MPRFLENRLKKNRYCRVQNCQTNIFLSLLEKKYVDVLEVGAGKGYFSYVGAINKKFDNCYSCDIFNDFQINEIKPFVKKIQYREIKNNVLPFEDNKFDLVFSIDVIEHVEDDTKFIEENIRVCKKGGKIIIGTPNYQRITNLFLKIIGRLKYPRKMGKDVYGDVIHIREYKKEDLSALIEKCESKIKNIKIIPCWFGIMPLNIGLNKVPKIAENLCQFWFLVFNKR